MATPPLVSCEWLREKIDAGGLDNIVIIDVSWSSTKDCYEDFKKAHIPGARHINVLDAAHTDAHPRNIPSSETFTAAARQAGVQDTTHVIVYSNSDRAGFFLAGRGWWTFRLYGHKNVSILDGGLEKWQKLGYPTTGDCPDVTPGNFTAQRTNEVFKSMEEVKNNITSSGFQLVDTRARQAHTDGGIPNALNIPMIDLVDVENSQLKPIDELKKLFSENNVDLSQPIVTHCNSGMSSASVAFAAMLISEVPVALFHGGYNEWTKSGKSTP